MVDEVGEAGCAVMLGLEAMLRTLFQVQIEAIGGFSAEE